MQNDRDHTGVKSGERSEPALALDRTLEEAAASLESVRALLSLRKTVARNLRVAIRRLLAAQEKIEVEGPSVPARLDLLEAIRLIGSVEQELKGSGSTVMAPRPTGIDFADVDLSDVEPEEVEPEYVEPADLQPGPPNRRAYRRVPAKVQIELEPERRGNRPDRHAMPLNGTTLNLSRGGMLARIDQGILRHGRYLIRFLAGGSGIQPAVTWGAVRRSRAREHGWEVGIEFDEPLVLK